MCDLPFYLAFPRTNVFTSIFLLIYLCVVFDIVNKMITPYQERNEIFRNKQ
jgi:hypothetical protein